MSQKPIFKGAASALITPMTAEGVDYPALKKLIQLWSNIMGYSIVPLRLATYFGYGFSLLGLLGAVIIIIRKLLVPTMAVGWPSMMVAICFFSGINLLFMGLIGEYIGRMFLTMGKQPQFVVRKVYSTDIADASVVTNPDETATIANEDQKG